MAAGVIEHVGDRQGVSGLFYVRQWDDLHLYVSPRWTYSHGSSSSSTRADRQQAQLLVAHGVGRRAVRAGQAVWVFGEVGFGYQHSHETGGSLIQADITGHTIGTRTGVGVILYF